MGRKPRQQAVDRSPKPASSPASRSRPNLWAAIGLVLLTAIVYSPVIHHDFVSLDDPTYVSANQHVADGLTWPAIGWAFSTGRAGNWHPLTWLSHLADVQLFGVSSGPHHGVNLVLHILNTLLLFIALHAMTGRTWPSAFVAALFAVHPLHVESVAWLAERKDVLSTVFWMATLWAYVGYVRQRTWFRYALVAGLLSVGLMAKPMLVTLPFVLLLLDVWPLGRVPALTGSAPNPTGSGWTWPVWRPLLLEKLPLMAIAAASGVVTFIAQWQGGAVSGMDTVPVSLRIANALVAYVTYILKMLWPTSLSIFYPLPTSVPILPAIGALVVLTAITMLALRALRTRPYVAVGWLWYLGTLVPVIGLVQVGTQAVADRYTYVPLVGLFIIVAWWFEERVAGQATRQLAAAIVGAVIVGGLAVGARAQVGVWKDSQALWQHALEVNPGNYYAHNALGALFRERGRTGDALSYLVESVRLNGQFPDARDNLGLVLVGQGRLDDAVTQYRTALQLNPGFSQAHNNLGVALAGLGLLDEAISHYRRALELDPDAAMTHNNLGQALASQGKLFEAITQYQEALRLEPVLVDARINLGLAFDAEGHHQEAIAAYTEAIELSPTSAMAHNNLAAALAAVGRIDDAITQYGEALRLDPRAAEPQRNLGFLLASQGKVTEAIGHFSDALRLKPDDAAARADLGMALGAAGRLDEAKAQFQEVLRGDPNNERARRGLARLAGRPPAGAVR